MIVEQLRQVPQDPEPKVQFSEEKSESVITAASETSIESPPIHRKQKAICDVCKASPDGLKRAYPLEFWTELKENLGTEEGLYTLEKQRKDQIFTKLNASVEEYYKLQVEFRQEYELQRVRRSPAMVLPNAEEYNRHIFQNSAVVLDEVYAYVKNLCLTLCKTPSLLLVLLRNPKIPTIQKDTWLLETLTTSFFEDLFASSDLFAERKHLWLLMKILESKFGQKGTYGNFFKERCFEDALILEYTKKPENARFFAQMIEEPLYAIMHIREDLEHLLREAMMPQYGFMRQSATIKIPDDMITNLSPEEEKVVEKVAMAASVLQPQNMSFEPDFHLISEDHITLKLVKSIVLHLLETMNQAVGAVPNGLKLLCKYMAILQPEDDKKCKYPLVRTYLFEKRLFPWISCPFENSFQTSPGMTPLNMANINLVIKVLRQVLAQDFFPESKTSYMALFNSFILETRPMVEKFFKVLLDVDEKLIPAILETDPESPADGVPALHSVCISLANIKQLCDFIEASEKNYEWNHPMKPILMKLVQNIQYCNRNKGVLEGRNHPETKKPLKAQQIFITFSELSFPKYFSTFEYSNSEKLGKNPDAATMRKFTLKKALKDVIATTRLSDFADKDNKPDLLDILDYITSVPKESLEVFQWNTKNQGIASRASRCLLAYLDVAQCPSPRRVHLGLLGQTLSDDYHARFTENMQTIAQINNNSWIALQSLQTRVNEAKNWLKIVANNKKRVLAMVFLQTLQIPICLYKLPKEKFVIVQKSECPHRKKTQTTTAKKGSASKTPLVDQNIEIHVDKLDDFVHMFASLKEVQEIFTEVEDSHGIKNVITTYLSWAIQAIKKIHDTVDMKTLEDTEFVVDFLEIYITGELGRWVLPKEPTFLDQLFSMKLKAFTWIRPHHLGLENPEYLENALYVPAEESLRRMAVLPSPLEKLRQLQNVWETVQDIVKLTSDQTDLYYSERDEIIPLSTYFLIKAAPERMKTTLIFLKNFLPENRKRPQAYAIAQLQTVMDQINKLGPVNIHFSKHESFETYLSNSEEMALIFERVNSAESPPPPPLHKKHSLA